MLLLVANGLMISNFVMLELLHVGFTVVEVLFGLRAVLQDASVWWFYTEHSGGFRRLRSLCQYLDLERTVAVSFYRLTPLATVTEGLPL